MAKSLLEFNRAYDYRLFVQDRQAAKAKPKESAIKSALFYGLLVAAVVFAFFFRSGNNAGQRFGPFAYNTVLTTSMTGLYNKGALVTSWALMPGEPVQAGLDKGTDIVFTIEKQNTNGTYMVVVHRIIEIIDNYEESGQRGFRTQGVANPTPDDWVVYEGNVIGKVTGHVEYLGDILAYIAEKIIWISGGLVAIFVLLTMLKVAFKKEEAKDRLMIDD